MIRTSREETLSVTTEPVNVKLLSETTIRRLKQEGRRLIHLGMIVIGVKGLVRKQVGGKLLLIIMDKSWQQDIRKAIIGTMEIDMNNNSGIFYCAPNFMVSINNVKNLEIGLQSKGYENHVGENILINIGFIGRTVNGSNT